MRGPFSAIRDKCEPPFFIDTAGWATFFVRAKPLHELCGVLIRSIRNTGRPAVTTNYVLAELSALLISPFRIAPVRRLEFIDTIRHAGWIEIVHIDSEVDDRGWKFMAKHGDKDFSLVDCSSFIVMADRGITAALTTDRHFEQAGFQGLLK